MRGCSTASARTCAALLRDGFVDADEATVAAATRYAALLGEVNAGTTVAVVLSPM